MIASARHICTALVLTLGVVWGGEALHSLTIPHFYCEQHDAFSHEAHDHSEAAEVAFSGTEAGHDHQDCHQIFLSHRSFFAPNQAVSLSAFVFSSSYELVFSRSVSGAKNYSFAPKNSPPV